MHTSIVLAALVSLAGAAPSNIKRTSSCALTGWASLSNSVNYGPGGSTWQGTGASSGFDLTVDGNSDPLWQCSFGSQDDCNPEAGSGTVIGTDRNHLDQLIQWNPTEINMGGCTCNYNGQEIQGVTDGSVFTGVTYNSGTNTCTCTFDCTTV